MIKVNATLTASKTRSNKRGNGSIIQNLATILRSSYIMDLHVRSRVKSEAAFQRAGLISLMTFAALSTDILGLARSNRVLVKCLAGPVYWSITT